MDLQSDAMELKDQDTNDSLGDDNATSQLIRAYSHPHNEQQVLALALAGFDVEEDGSVVDLMSHREQLTEALEKISRAKQLAYLAHNAADKLQQCALQQGPIAQSQRQGAQESLQAHAALISGLQQQTEAILAKIAAYRSVRLRVEAMRGRSARMNALMLKKYNMRNYVEQMELVREMLERIAGKLRSNSFDFRFLEEILGKELIPYSFYRHYCLNVACLVLSKRLQQQELVVLRQASALPQLLAHMQQYFFSSRDLYENCSQLLRLMQVVRVVNAQGQSVEDGFALLFRPYFLRALEQGEEIECTSFMKARSLMQASPFTVELWREFEEEQAERYVLWHFEQFNYLRKSDLLHLARLKQTIAHFRQRFQWINSTALRSSRIHGSNDFPSDFLRAALLKVLAPFLNQLYEAALSGSDRRTAEKHRQEFHLYWTYCTFGKYPQLHRFICPSLDKYLACRPASEEGELNRDQYYKYYQQMGDLLEEDLGTQFRALWSECWIRVCSLSQPIARTMQENPDCCDLIEQVYHVKEQEAGLQQLLRSKKGKKEERAEDIYCKVVNLNLNSSKYFLLREALRQLDKSAERELSSIRDIAYQHLF